MKTNYELFMVLEQVKQRVHSAHERQTPEDWERIASELKRAAAYASKCARLLAAHRAKQGVTDEAPTYGLSVEGLSGQELERLRNMVATLGAGHIKPEPRS